MIAPQLFLAFDSLREKPDETLHEMYQLSDAGESFGIKFNLDAMLSPSTLSLWSIGKNVMSFKRPVFADIKMWNGSRTMELVVKTFVDMGVDFINIYALAEKELAKAVSATAGSKTKILALTVLSHYNDAYCQKWFGRSLQQAVVDFSRFAMDVGFHGLILPGTTLGAVKDLHTTKMATGVRPEWYKDNRHEQEATPAEVAKGGAHFAVCGSPVLKQPTLADKILALRRINEEMQRAVV
jgi:orotidine-5'-phosphate decarboxylase